MSMKINFIVLITSMFFAGACATKTKTGPGSDVVMDDSKGAAIGSERALADATPDAIRIGSAMDRQAEELQRALAGSRSAAVKREQDMLIVTFRSDTMFNFDSVAIKPGPQTEIRRVAEVLYRYPQTRIRIEGHTDSIGVVESNQKLSARRADAVKNELIAQNLQPDRIEVVGFGAARPVASNKTPDGRCQNRRVQIFVIPVREPL